MTISLKNGFRTIEELRESPEAILRQVQKSEQPVVVTVKGKPAAVVLAVEQYEWMTHLLEFGRELAKGEESIRVLPES